jgi:Protein of unknown function (DUF3237)
MGATAAATGMELQYEFEFHAMLKPPLEIGAGPFGTRLFFEATEGEVAGERLSGRLLTGGGDWLLVGPDGWGRLDVRTQIETHDGAHIYITYDGVLEMTEGFQKAFAEGGETGWEDQYFRTTPRLETGDPRYAWLNQSVFVAQGRAYPGLAVQYRVFRVA